MRQCAIPMGSNAEKKGNENNGEPKEMDKNVTSSDRIDSCDCYCCVCCELLAQGRNRAAE